MKRIIVLLTLTMISFLTASAQEKVYCEIRGVHKFLSKKVTVEIDFGQQTKFFSDNRLVDENGKVRVFNSMIDAMNFMGTMGWEFEQAYVVTEGTDGNVQSVCHWLLSKEVGEKGDTDTLKTRDIIKRQLKEAEAQN